MISNTTVITTTVHVYAPCSWSLSVVSISGFNHCSAFVALLSVARFHPHFHRSVKPSIQAPCKNRFQNGAWLPGVAKPIHKTFPKRFLACLVLHKLYINRFQDGFWIICVSKAKIETEHLSQAMWPCFPSFLPPSLVPSLLVPSLISCFLPPSFLLPLPPSSFLHSFLPLFLPSSLPTISQSSLTSILPSFLPSFLHSSSNPYLLHSI